MKILLNSLYGALALPSFRYGSIILSESITLSGQRIIQESALTANRHMNKLIKGSEEDKHKFIEKIKQNKSNPEEKITNTNVIEQPRPIW